MTRTPFTLESYADRLQRTADRFQAVGFDVIGDPELNNRRFCLIRHDIDFCPTSALAIARLEADKGIRATYAVLLTSPFYNALELRVREELRAIADMGHWMALHFDAACHDIQDQPALEHAITVEAEALSSLLKVEVQSFAFHNTTPFTMACSAPRYAGLWNAYADVLQQEVSYVSDSNGYWRFRDWDEALAADPPRIQVLTHPEWWTEPHMQPAEKISHILQERTARTWADFVALLQRAGRSIVSADPATQTLLLQLDELELLRRWLFGDRGGAYLQLLSLIASEQPRQEQYDGSADEHAALAKRLIAGEATDAQQVSAAFGRATSRLWEFRKGRAVARNS